jgi:hypothetical protein
MPKRECPNWLKTFLDFTKPVSEAPESLLTWSGLFCISAVTKRKIQFSQEYLKKYRIYPTTYVMFVGPPGVITKSTTAGYGLEVIAEMLDGMPITDPSHVNIGQTSGSHIGIIQQMQKTLDGSLTIIAGEFGNLVSSMPKETYDFLSKMFDSDKTAEKYVHGTRQHGVEAIMKPSLNILGCTTPDWMAENSGYMLGGGFAARTVFIFENQKRQRRLFYKGIGPNLEQLDKMREGLAKDLRRIGQLKGEAKPETEALADEMEDWYQEIENFKGERGTETFQQRKHVHVLRTAMLLSLCERDDLIITKEHYDRAMVLIADVESKLGRGLSTIGRNPYSALLFEILEFIRENQPVDRGRIVGRFWRDFVDNPDRDVGVILETLKATGKIEQVEAGTKITYRIKKGS